MLFINPAVSFEKVAYSKLLEKDPLSWPVGVIKEAYSQLPYLKDYELDVSIDRTDAARGYGVGKLLVYPARMTKRAAVKSSQIVSFPVIIKDRELAPLDVLTHKKIMFAESEEKVATILHKPNTFERPAKPGEFSPVSMISKLNPPTDTGSQTRYSGYLGKVASVTEAAIHTFNKQDVISFLEKIAEGPALTYQYKQNSVLSGYAQQFHGWSEKTAEDRWRALLSRVKPTVLQFSEDGLDYKLKIANHRAFFPTQIPVSRYEIKEILSKEAVDALSKNKVLTLATDPVTRSAPKIKTASKIAALGVYKVKIANQDVEGIVIPKMIDFDGNLVGNQIFVGPTQHAIQASLVGSFVKEASVGGAYPRGKGVFVYQEGDLSVATEPVEITNVSTTYLNKEKLASLHATKLSTGAPITLTVVPGLQKIATLADEIVALPGSFEFLPISGKQVTACSDEGDYLKSEKVKVASGVTTTIVSDGASYSLRGNGDDTFDSILNQNEAEFALGALGLTGAQARTIIKKASVSGSEVFSSRQIVSQEQAKLSYAKTIARVTPNEIAPLRVNLIKEASVVVDKETVDSILSLQFMTPENVGIYVDYLPEFEKAASKLAEVLIASRLGMDDIKESAAKNALTQVSAVIGGLTNLRDKVV